MLWSVCFWAKTSPRLSCDGSIPVFAMATAGTCRRLLCWGCCHPGGSPREGGSPRPAGAEHPITSCLWFRLNRVSPRALHCSRQGEGKRSIYCVSELWGETRLRNQPECLRVLSNPRSPSCTPFPHIKGGCRGFRWVFWQPGAAPEPAGSCGGRRGL